MLTVRSACCMDDDRTSTTPSIISVDNADAEDESTTLETLQNVSFQTRPVDSEIQHLERISWGLDNSIRLPVINYRVGIDPIVSLLPVGGDVITSTFSLYIIYKAYRLNVSVKALILMILNVCVDGVVGVFPVYGSLVDAVWKANERNINIIKSEQEHGTISNTAFMKTLFVAILPVMVTILFIIGIAGLLYIQIDIPALRRGVGV